MVFLWAAKLIFVCALLGGTPKFTSSPPATAFASQFDAPGKSLAQRTSKPRDRAVAKRVNKVKKVQKRSGFLAFILPVLVFVATLIVAFLHRRGRLEGAAQNTIAAKKTRRVHFAKPRSLKHEGGPDPATMTDDALNTGAIIPLAGRAAKVAVDIHTQAHVAIGQNLVENDLTSAGLKLKQADLVQPMQPTPELSLHLPAELASLFTGLPKERLLAHARFQAFGEANGMMAVTNRRVLVAYSQTMTRLWPPFFVTQEKRHRLPLSQIDEVRPGSSYRIAFLWPSLVLSWWYPIGTLVSLAAIVVYYALPRTVLEIVSGPLVRKYPLQASDLDTMMQTVGRKAAELRGKRQARRARQAG